MAVLDHSLVVMLRFCLQQKVWRGWIYVAYLNFVLVYVAFIVVVAKGASVRVLVLRVWGRVEGDLCE